MNTESVFLSASCPSPEQEESFNYALDDVLRYIANRGLRVVFGAHPSVTPKVLAAVAPENVEMHILARFAEGLQVPEGATVIVHDTEGDIGAQLTVMRKAMAQSADSAWFLGGKLAGLGGKAGIAEEFEIFKAEKPEGPTKAFADAGGAAVNLPTSQGSASLLNGPY